MPFLVILLIVQLVAVGATPVIESYFASHDNAPELMRELSAVDVSDRNMNTWWDQFSVSWAEYDLKVKQDPTLYCSAHKKLLSELRDLRSKVNLVLDALATKEEQLSQIREILEHTEMGGKTGLHCKEDPEQAICKALDSLDKQAAEERVRLDGEKKTVTDEITNVKEYNCDCTYNDWAADWGACSVTCEVGIKKETRAIKWKKRNDGKDCVPADAQRSETCNAGCCPKDCVWADWGPWTACPEILTSDPQYEYAHRSILVEHECSERGGRACEGETKKSRKCNILQIKNEEIAEKEKEIESLEEELKGLKEGCHVEESNTEDKLCEPNPCMNGGECSKGVCTCPKGYKGDKCQIDELCPTDTCKNFSHCSQGVCTCAKGWTGTNCEIHENCSPNPCQNGGVCDYGVCTCDKGWLGNHCEKDALCDPNPCLNGGECSKGVCSCTKGNFMGGRCEIDVLCSTNPCLNGAQCSQGECSCPPGWTGGRCEHLALVNGGCYEDNGSRMLRDKENKAMLNNSPANCRNFCSGYRYYGVQYTMECFCGNRIHFLLPKSSNECNANCSGNGGQKCGGTWRMNVYENENWE